MAKIISKEEIANQTYSMYVHTPLIAKKCKPGQFVVIRLDEKGERIPLTIANFDRNEGNIRLVFQVVGKTTLKLSRYGVGKDISDVTGPLGNPSEISNYGTVVMVGGGVGIAPIYPIARALKEVGNEVITILGARSKSLLIMEEDLASVSDELLISTDDGSKGKKGFVTDVLKELLDSGKNMARVWAIGPAIMMRFISELTVKYGVPTIVSLNSIMVDGTGMCGACRVNVGGETKFTCVDGPEFDGHKVDFKLLMERLSTYKREEKIALENYEKRIRASG
ncbi:MAG: sulfide/dihydroorotate dehydrogenase-like FAD/NAD-binding protein [Thermotogae bacterium]|nr:sulfide/dihydroorotate dehydrogenase-like FAD/NAD-binding protein [Thermotogota bacterium]